MTAVVVALAAAVLLLAVLVAGLLRSHAEILRALHELGAGLELDREGDGAGPVPVTIDPIAAPRSADGQAAPLPSALSGTTLDGEDVALSLTGGHDTLLAFLSSGCATCQAFWSALDEPDLAVPGGARLVVVAQDLVDESESALRQRVPSGVPVVLSSSAWQQFAVPGSPYFVYVDGAAGRVVGEGSAAGWPQVVDLMGQARADALSRGQVAGDGAHRRGRDDTALLAAGIGPGHPSLHPSDEEPA